MRLHCNSGEKQITVHTGQSTVGENQRQVETNEGIQAWAQHEQKGKEIDVPVAFLNFAEEEL